MNRGRPVRFIVVNTAIVAVLLVLIEGLASWALVGRSTIVASLARSPRDTKYDPQLGWVTKPMVDIPDMYGPGKSLRTNAQGFRHDGRVAPTVPAGKVRAICSGDSFTFGIGVDNEHTWCRILSSLQPALETVNMGENAYGLDQVYLRYMREAADIQHQIQLLALIKYDFVRMQSDSYRGIPKPVLDVQNHRLIVGNVPVPHKTGWVAWGSSMIGSLGDLRTMELLNGLRHHLHGAGARLDEVTTEERRVADDRTREVVDEMFRILKAFHERHSSRLVLIYLPSMEDIQTDNDSDEWATFLERESAANQFLLINLRTDFRSLPYHEVVRFFIAPGEPGAGHFTEKGHEFAARVIHERLLQSGVLAPTRASASPH